MIRATGRSRASTGLLMTAHIYCSAPSTQLKPERLAVFEDSSMAGILGFISSPRLRRSEYDSDHYSTAPLPAGPEQARLLKGFQWCRNAGFSFPDAVPRTNRYTS